MTVPALPVSASDLLPHAGYMCCIDTLLEERVDNGVASVVLHEGHALVTNGVLDRAGFIELAAQTAGAYKGYARSKRGLEPGPGFLVGVQDFLFFGDAYAGDELRIAVRLTGEFRGVSVVLVAVTCQGRELASGKLKLYEPGQDGSSGGV